MLWVPADAQTRASSSVSSLWYIPRTNICTVKRQNAPVPSRCCPSCTPSTRCSSRATTCWMRSTRTWRSWLPRWAKRLRRRSACCSISHQSYHRFIPPPQALCLHGDRVYPHLNYRQEAAAKCIMWISASWLILCCIFRFDLGWFVPNKLPLCTQ